MIAKYGTAFIGECEKAVKWSTELVTEWIDRNMPKDDPQKEQKIGTILKELGDHSVCFYAHNSHLSILKQGHRSQCNANLRMTKISRTAVCPCITSSSIAMHADVNFYALYPHH